MPLAQVEQLAAQAVVAIRQILSYNKIEVLWTGVGSMHIAICEDNPQDLQQLCALVQQYEGNMQVTTFASARALYEDQRSYP